jgi:hypothetical protein
MTSGRRSRSDEASGFCEDSKVCSFVDLDCGSGRRFGKLAGETSNECVDDGAQDASPIDARVIDSGTDVRVDAMNQGPPDASPPDAMPVCGPTTNGALCPELGDCPNSEGSCCSYMITGIDVSCDVLCENLGKICDRAANTTAECVAGANRSCGSKDEDILCACK